MFEWIRMMKKNNGFETFDRNHTPKNPKNDIMRLCWNDIYSIEIAWFLCFSNTFNSRIIIDFGINWSKIKIFFIGKIIIIHIWSKQIYLFLRIFHFFHVFFNFFFFFWFFPIEILKMSSHFVYIQIILNQIHSTQFTPIFTGIHQKSFSLNWRERNEKSKMNLLKCPCLPIVITLLTVEMNRFLAEFILICQ